jgi:hypothetical protein
MKKQDWKFLGILLFALLLLMAGIGFSAWHAGKGKIKAPAKKPVAICGKLN